MLIPEKLISQVIIFVSNLSAAQAEKTYELLFGAQENNWGYLRLVLRTGLPLDFHWHTNQLIDVWEREFPDVSPQCVAFAVLSAHRASSQVHNQ